MVTNSVFSNVGGRSAIISISFTSVFGSGTRLKKVDSGMTALLECSIPRAGVFPALGWVDHFKDQIRKKIENKLTYSYSGEHWDRATVLDHGEQLGQAAEGNPHRGHPGLTSWAICLFYLFIFSGLCCQCSEAADGREDETCGWALGCRHKVFSSMI